MEIIFILSFVYKLKADRGQLNGIIIEMVSIVMYFQMTETYFKLKDELNELLELDVKAFEKRKMA